MKKALTALLPYLLVLGIDFYLLPCLMKDTGTAMLLLLVVMPLLAFLPALIYGMRRGFSLLLPAAALLLFLPTLPLYYNVSAWVYAVFYAAVVLAGTGVGRAFHGKR